MIDRTHNLLRSIAERGSARDPRSIYEAALNESSDLAPDERSLGDQGRPRARFAAAALVVAAVGIGAAAWVTTTGSEPADYHEATDSMLCQVLSDSASPSRADAFVFLEPGSISTDVARVHEALALLPGLTRLEYLDRDQTWSEFRELFRDDPTMLENVEPDDLPTSFELDFDTFDERARDALQRALRPVGDVLQQPGFEAASELRVLDIIALAGPLASDPGAASADIVIASSIGTRLEAVADGDPTIDPTTREDLNLMAQTIGGSTRLVLTIDQAEVSTAASRLIDRAEEQCGLEIHETLGAGDGQWTSDSWITSTTERSTVGGEN